MQQPDYRDQSESEVKEQAEENSQSESNKVQKQGTSQNESQEEQTNEELVRHSLTFKGKHTLTHTCMHMSICLYVLRLT